MHSLRKFSLLLESSAVAMHPFSKLAFKSKLPARTIGLIGGVVFESLSLKAQREGLSSLDLAHGVTRADLDRRADRAGEVSRGVGSMDLLVLDD